MNGPQNYITPPLTVAGFQYNCMERLMMLLPTDIRVFVDLFCGSGLVGLNACGLTRCLNDKNENIISLYQELQKRTPADIIRECRSIVYDFNLTKGGEEAYRQLRDVRNTTRNSIQTLVLCYYTFNKTMRTNSQGNFNAPYTKRTKGYDKWSDEELTAFLNNLQGCRLSSFDFRQIRYDTLCDRDFIYVNPPTLLAKHSNGWTKSDRDDLIQLLDELTRRSIRWALADETHRYDKYNKTLTDWYCGRHYNTFILYKDNVSSQILVTNYQPISARDEWIINEIPLPF